MKKKLIGFVIITLISISCQKEKLDVLGNIQGMGNAPGNLEVKAPFTFPQGITLIGDISGLNNPGLKSGGSKSESYSTHGSGGKMIKLKLTLLNSSDKPKTIFFPKGLLWECNISGYQNAILLQTTWISLKANSKREIIMDLYCVNFGLKPSDGISTFKILGVSKSTIIGKLLTAIGWKKINFEMIYGTYATGKGTAEPTYEQITERLQNIVWNLTDHSIDITPEDQAFIENIPELAPAEIPALDENSQFPEYFDEFVAPGK